MDTRDEDSLVPTEESDAANTLNLATGETATSLVPTSTTDATTDATAAVSAPAIALDAPNPNFRPHSSLTLPSCSDPIDFCRNVQWCADGSSALAVMEGASLELLDMNDTGLKHRLSIKQAAPILSTAWYPTASLSNPASYCFVGAIRDQPVRLLDALDGRVRASYKIIDHRERFIAPSSMTFNGWGNKLYCGFEDAIEVFDVQQPGEGERLHTVPTKKSRDGLRGIISSLAFATDWSGLYAAGSFSGAIALYTEDTGAQVQGWLDDVEGGVTQIRFNPTQPHILYASFRRSPTIARWDLRNPSQFAVLYDRGGVATNQRLHFDVSPDGRWVVAGDERGKVSIFDALGEEGCISSIDSAHKDAIGTANFHPARPLLLTASGSRHFEEADSDTSESEMEDVEVLVSGVQTVRRGPVAMDNSVRLWSYGEVQAPFVS